MDKQKFNDAIVKIYQYYQVDKKPNEYQMNLWFEMVKPIPNLAVDQVLYNIFKEFDSCPRNIAKALVDHSKGISYDKHVTYDAIEDIRFPVSLMVQAYELLEKQGETAFHRFCDSYRMPSKDRERVQQKFEYIHNHNNMRGRIRELIRNKLGDRNPFSGLLKKMASNQPIKERASRYPGQEDECPI